MVISLECLRILNDVLLSSTIHDFSLEMISIIFILILESELRRFNSECTYVNFFSVVEAGQFESIFRRYIESN